MPIALGEFCRHFLNLSVLDRHARDKNAPQGRQIGAYGQDQLTLKIMDAQHMSQPLVSIILPARDEEAYIAAALHSALGQTYRNIEVIVVDDGSRDRTAAIVRRRAASDSRLRLLTGSGRGVAAARNSGIAASNGEFIAPLDADDLWDPMKIERQIQKMVEGHRVGLVYCWWLLIDAAGDVLDRSPRWRFEGACAEPLLEVNYVGSASVPMFRTRRVRDVGGYDESLRDRGGEGAEDWDLALRIAEMSDVGLVPQPLVAYRRRPRSMSTRAEQMWRSHALLLASAQRRRPNLSSATLRRSRAQFALHLAGVSFWSRQYLSATRWVLRGCRSTTFVRMLPHAFKLLYAFRARSNGHPRLRIEAGATFSNWSIPEPLMPYNDVYDSSR